MKKKTLRFCPDCGAYEVSAKPVQCSCGSKMVTHWLSNQIPASLPQILRKKGLENTEVNLLDLGTDEDGNPCLSRWVRFDDVYYLPKLPSCMYHEEIHEEGEKRYTMVIQQYIRPHDIVSLETTYHYCANELINWLRYLPPPLKLDTEHEAPPETDYERLLRKEQEENDD